MTFHGAQQGGENSALVEKTPDTARARSQPGAPDESPTSKTSSTTTGPTAP
jgi:hypothetical protein